MATIEEYNARATAGERIEFSRGVVLPMPNNDSVHDYAKGFLASELARSLPRPALVVNEMAFEVTSEYIRHPDVAVLLTPPPRLEGRKVQGAPDLAIEVVSESDNAASLDDRIDLYLTHGAQAVWVVWPRKQRLDIHQSRKPTRHLRPGDVLAGEDPIPNFRLEVAELFR